MLNTEISAAPLNSISVTLSISMTLLLIAMALSLASIMLMELHLNFQEKNLSQALMADMNLSLKIAGKTIQKKVV